MELTRKVSFNFPKPLISSESKQNNISFWPKQDQSILLITSQLITSVASAGLASSFLGSSVLALSSPENKKETHYSTILFWVHHICVWFSDRPPSSGRSEVQRVRLSLRSCMIKVLSLYDSSLRVSNSAIASSKACFARWQALQKLTTLQTKLTPDVISFKCWCLLKKWMRPFRRVHDLIVENREVKSKAKTNRVGRRKLSACSLCCSLIKV